MQDSTPFGNFLREVGDDLAALRADRPPSSGAGIPWRRLTVDLPTAPDPRESLRSVVARSCHANFLPNSWGLLQYVGLAHRNQVYVSEDPNIDPAELAYAMRVPTDEVLKRRYAPLGRDHVDFFGLDVHIGRLVKQVRRFSPTGLIDGEFHRATWELRDVPFCLESWEMLEDTCWCRPEGVVQRWTRTKTKLHECDQCGDPLTWIEASSVPDNMREALSVLTAIVDPVEDRRAALEHLIPEAIRHVDRGKLFHVIRSLAFGVDPHAEDRSPHRPAVRLHGLHAACRALIAWPQGINEVVWHPDAPRTASMSFRTRWLGLDGGPHRRATKSDPDLRPGRAQSTRQIGGEPDGVGTSKSGKPRPIGIRPATELARLSPETLKFAWDEKLVTPHQRVHGPQTLVAFDPAELPEFGEMWNARVSATTLADRLGVPPYGIEQLIALGGLRADAPAMPGTGPHFHPATAASLAERLLDAASTGRFDDPVPLSSALILVGRRLKPWGPLILALLGEMPGTSAIPFRLEGDGPLLRRVRVAGGSVPHIAALRFDHSAHPGFAFSDRISQGDALAVLNITFRAAGLLARLGSRGANPKTYSVSAVLSRAEEVVSTPEIAARLGISVPEARKRARRSGWREVVPGVWEAAEPEKAFASEMSVFRPQPRAPSGRGSSISDPGHAETGA